MVPMIQSVKLKGHTASVLCLDHSSGNNCLSPRNDPCLASGSEDGTCRVWDLRASCRAALCIKCPGGGDVLSVAFGPRWNQDALPNSSPFAREYSVYTAVENTVYGYDLRNITSPIVSEPSNDLSFLGASDEINQIAFSPIRVNPTIDGRSKRYMQLNIVPYFAAADDSGAVRITDSFEAADDKQLRNKHIFVHGNVSLVTTLAYCPPATSKQLLLASGGTDCCIQLWDVGKAVKSKSANPVCSVSIPSTVDGASNQVYNPPMVHSLNWSPSGQLLAAGLGDGSVVLLLRSGASLVQTARLHNAHSGSVASCLFPEWSINGSDAIEAHDRLLCTTGNDGLVVLWDLGATVGGEKATSPADTLRRLQADSIEDINQSLDQLQFSKGARTMDPDIDASVPLLRFKTVPNPTGW